MEFQLRKVMSTSREIIFFSKDKNPTIQKMIEFSERLYDKTNKHTRFVFDKNLCCYGREDVWIHKKGADFSYFGMNNVPAKYDGLKSFIYIGQSNTTYEDDNGKSYLYNYPYFKKLMEHIKDDDVSDIYLFCKRNSQSEKPKWMNEWKGQFLRTPKNVE